MSDKSPWNRSVIEEGRTRRAYDSACRHLEQANNQTGLYAEKDQARWERAKDQAFAEMMTAMTRKD